LLGGDIDYLPIAKTVGQYPIYTTISSCSVLDQENTTYYLTQDLYSETSCINIASNNIVFDCNYHTIAGNGSESAVWTYNTDNITVRNCILTNFSEVVWGATNNSRFENLEISNGVVRGITLGGENLTLSNITIHSTNTGLAGTMQFSEMSNIKVYSSDWGIDIFGYNNTLSNSELWNITSRAIGLQTGGNMRVENTIIRDSWGVGIWVDWESNGNTIDNVTIYNLPNDFPIYITSDNNMVKNSLIYNSYAGIGIHGNGDYDTLENIEVFNTSDIGIGIDGSNHVLRNLTVHSTRGILVWGGSNHLLENIETFDTIPDWAGLAINSENTILRNIYNHDEYRSTLGGTNNTLEYSRCENVEYGCWHLFGNNTTVRHSNFPSGISLFGSSYGEIYNNTIGGIDIYDWFGSGSFYNEIYNNYVSRYECGISLTNSGDSLFYNNTIISSPIICMNGINNITITNNTFEGDVLAHYDGVVSNVLSCNNTATFNKSYVFEDGTVLLNVMRIESDSCIPYISYTVPTQISFGSVLPYNTYVNDTEETIISSNMINITFSLKGTSDFVSNGYSFSISNLNFSADKNFPYPVEEITLELNAVKNTFLFLVSQTNNIIYNLWKLEVPKTYAGDYTANVSLEVSV
jgi:parallel beta-helix repeat protein